MDQLESTLNRQCSTIAEVSEEVERRESISSTMSNIQPDLLSIQSFGSLSGSTDDICNITRSHTGSLKDWTPTGGGGAGVSVTETGSGVHSDKEKTDSKSESKPDISAVRKAFWSRKNKFKLPNKFSRLHWRKGAAADPQNNKPRFETIAILAAQSAGMTSLPVLNKQDNVISRTQSENDIISGSSADVEAANAHAKDMRNACINKANESKGDSNIESSITTKEESFNDVDASTTEKDNTSGDTPKTPPGPGGKDNDNKNKIGEASGDSKSSLDMEREINFEEFETEEPDQTNVNVLSRVTEERSFDISQYQYDPNLEDTIEESNEEQEEPPHSPRLTIPDDNAGAPNAGSSAGESCDSDILQMKSLEKPPLKRLAQPIPSGPVKSIGNDSSLSDQDLDRHPGGAKSIETTIEMKDDTLKVSRTESLSVDLKPNSRFNSTQLKHHRSRHHGHYHRKHHHSSSRTKRKQREKEQQQMEQQTPEPSPAKAKTKPVREKSLLDDPDAQETWLWIVITVENF